MKRLHNIVSIVVGLVLMLSGIGKALNVIGFQQLIHSYGLLYLDLLAPVIVMVELVLGGLLVLRCRIRTTSLWTGLMIIVFTGVYTFGYTRVGITDCGYFGVAATGEWPAWAVYVRNIILLALLNYLFFFASDDRIEWTAAKRVEWSKPSNILQNKPPN